MFNALEDDFEAFEWVLSKNVDINYANDDGITPLYQAVVRNWTPFVRRLLDLGAVPRDALAAQPGVSSNLLLHAFENLNRDVMDWLVTAGATIDYQDDDGSTLLHLALIKEDYQSFEFFMNAGVALWKPNNANMTAEQLARGVSEGANYRNAISQMRKKVTAAEIKFQSPLVAKQYAELVASRAVVAFAGKHRNKLAGDEGEALKQRVLVAARTMPSILILHTLSTDSQVKGAINTLGSMIAEEIILTAPFGEQAAHFQVEEAVRAGTDLWKRTALRNLESDNQDADDEKLALNAKFTSLATEMKRLTQRVIDLESNASDLRVRVKTIEDSIPNQIEQAKRAVLFQVDTKEKALKLKSESIEQHLSQVESRLDQRIIPELSEVSQRVNGLQAQVADAARSVEVANMGLQRSASDMQHLAYTVNNLEMRLAQR